MKYSIFVFIAGLFFTNSLSAKIVQIEKLPSLSKILCPLSGKRNPIRPHIHRYKVLYETKDFYGNNTLASGLIAIPASNQANLSPLLYLHATSNTKQDVPSMGSIESKFVACKAIQNKRVLIAPDYLGMGSHVGDHPYMMSDITVSVSIDMLDATYEFFRENRININQDLVLAGYSQGGHATLAIHKHLDLNPSMQYKVVKSFAMSGPANLSNSMLNSMIYDEPSENTSFFGALVIANYQSFYGDIYSVRAFKPEYQLAEQYGLDINKKAIKKLLPKNLMHGLDSYFVNEIKHNLESSFKQRLAESDIEPWYASAPIILSYSSGDKSIPPKDSFQFYDQMRSIGSNISIRQSSNLKHRINFIPSLIQMSRDLK